MAKKPKAEKPPEETRGGEEPFDWKVAASAVADAAAWRAQQAVTDVVVTHAYGGDVGSEGQDSAE